MLSKDDRIALAEQLKSNALWGDLLDRQEKRFMAQLVRTDDEGESIAFKARVRAIQALRKDCQSEIDNNFTTEAENLPQSLTE